VLQNLKISRNSVVIIIREIHCSRDTPAYHLSLDAIELADHSNSRIRTGYRSSRSITPHLCSCLRPRPRRHCRRRIETDKCEIFLCVTSFAEAAAFQPSVANADPLSITLFSPFSLSHSRSPLSLPHRERVSPSLSFYLSLSLSLVHFRNHPPHSYQCAVFSLSFYHNSTPFISLSWILPLPRSRFRGSSVLPACIPFFTCDCPVPSPFSPLPDFSYPVSLFLSLSFSLSLSLSLSSLFSHRSPWCYSLLLLEVPLRLSSQVSPATCCMTCAGRMYSILIYLRMSTQWHTHTHTAGDRISRATRSKISTDAIIVITIIIIVITIIIIVSIAAPAKKDVINFLE